MKKFKLYLAGPMSDLPDSNFPAFNREAQRLRDLGYDIVNPAEITVGIRPTDLKDLELFWRRCLIADIHYLIECDGVATMPGFWWSKGAALEVTIAMGLKLPVVESRNLRAYQDRISTGRPDEQRTDDSRGGAG